MTETPMNVLRDHAPRTSATLALCRWRSRGRASWREFLDDALAFGEHAAVVEAIYDEQRVLHGLVREETDSGRKYALE